MTTRMIDEVLTDWAPSNHIHQSETSLAQSIIASNIVLFQCDNFTLADNAWRYIQTVHMKFALESNENESPE